MFNSFSSAYRAFDYLWYQFQKQNLFINKGRNCLLCAVCGPLPSGRGRRGSTIPLTGAENDPSLIPRKQSICHHYFLPWGMTARSHLCYILSLQLTFTSRSLVAFLATFFFLLQASLSILPGFAVKISVFVKATPQDLLWLIHSPQSPSLRWFFLWWQSSKPPVVAEVKCYPHSLI